MLIAGTVDLAETLAELALRRPVFHSERDFQVALAWQVHLVDPAIHVHLETRPSSGVHLDLAFESLDREHYSAVELKYFTKLWSGVVDGEQFDLKAQGAHDLGGWGVVKDITRLEQFIKLRSGANGAVIALTNDPKYWLPSPNSTANDTAFRLGEGTILEGLRAWRRPPAGSERSAALELAYKYDLHWTDFSSFEPTLQFRQLVIGVPRSIV